MLGCGGGATAGGGAAATRVGRGGAVTALGVTLGHGRAATLGDGATTTLGDGAGGGKIIDGRDTGCSDWRIDDGGGAEF